MKLSEELYISGNPANVHVDLSEDLQQCNRNFLIRLAIRYPMLSGLSNVDNGDYILFYNYETLIAWYNTVDGIGFIPEKSCHIL